MRGGEGSRLHERSYPSQGVYGGVFDAVIGVFAFAMVRQLRDLLVEDDLESS